MPSVVSSPNPHNSRSQDNGNTKENLLALMGEKDVVEAELKALGAILDSVSSLTSKMRNSILPRVYLILLCYTDEVDPQAKF